MYSSIFAALCAISRKDPEIAHRLVIRLLHAIERSPTLTGFLALWAGTSQDKPVNLCGITFPHRVGLAAGFDKHAEAIIALTALGFGFIEVGTVLPEAQVGNDRPRIFRIDELKSLINRMGFNSDGVAAVAARLDAYTRSGRHIAPLGISLGKMKGTPNEEAVRDYLVVRKCTFGHGAYLVANVSSPNTPGLRALQGRRELEGLLGALVRAEREEAAGRSEQPRPLFAKIAPDNMEDGALEDTIEALLHAGGSGLIIGNTTLARPMMLQLHRHRGEAGGLSGPPLFEPMERLVAKARSLDAKLPLIAAGGIDSAKKALRARAAGADLVQIYTGFIYRGPPLVHELRRAL